ncbi:THUMP domain-containing class I SAM-dependent RNA methyltransferase [Agathobaculum sp.]|uniref:THUMP domain-containing class I SAM-dependent RNA methyltransferase n=1 Tax=Agathobaculum sp. TaxID=2048138 RepID=UPI002A83F555|nr:class I SAM-dependent RNA methyltransferase [Agathobaculum sp.]MDY3618065.1 class I SAM-dependent RNA methyltransferase [Agathobaculum sp.]
MELTMCCPTLFGLEGIVADELRFGGKLNDVQAENGRVLFEGDERTLAWANLHLRCAERVLIRLGTFSAQTFDMLFEGVRALPWEQFIPKDGSFPVKGYSLDSALHSIPDCQKIIKKAVVERLGRVYGQNWFDETGAKYQIQFSIMHDTAELFLDTSGAGLHKRGYRANANAAPLRETLAAAMVKLARWRGKEPLLDPFCGSGTIAIEAAMIATRRAPGLMRAFDADKWACIDTNVWRQAREDALEQMDGAARFDIAGSDLDPDCVALSQENAKKAGVLHTIRFTQADACKLDYRKKGTLFANPPYGERLLDMESAQKLYASFGRAVGHSPMKQYILSSDIAFERFFGKKADKRRKLYNGMIKCDLYMYFKHSPRPSAKTSELSQNGLTKNS